MVMTMMWLILDSLVGVSFCKTLVHIRNFSSLIHPDSVIVARDPVGKPSPNSGRCFLPLKMTIGGMKFPMALVQAKMVTSPYFSTHVWAYTVLLPFSANTFLVDLLFNGKPDSSAF